MRGIAGGVALALVLCTAHAGAQAAAPIQPQPSATAAALDSLRAQNAALTARVDSLTQSLRDHRVSEDFFSSGLEAQTGWYGAVVAAALFIFGLITFGGFRWEVNRHKQEMSDKLAQQKDEVNRQKEGVIEAVARRNQEMVEALQKQQDEVNRQKQEMLEEIEKQKNIARQVETRQTEAERRMRRTAGNAYLAIASSYETRKPAATIAALLQAGANFYAAQHDPNDPLTKAGTVNLNAALLKLKAVKEMESKSRTPVTDELAKERDKIKDAFELLRTHGTRDVEGLVAKIRSLWEELVEDTYTTAPEAP